MEEVKVLKKTVQTTGLITAERVLEAATETAVLRDGTILADVDLGTCTQERGHKGCVATYRIEPCGCVSRITTHFIYDRAGMFLGAKKADSEGTNYNFKRCKEHKTNYRGGKNLLKIYQKGLTG